MPVNLWPERLGGGADRLSDQCCRLSGTLCRRRNGCEHGSVQAFLFRQLGEVQATASQLKLDAFMPQTLSRMSLAPVRSLVPTDARDALPAAMRFRSSIIRALGPPRT